MLLNQIPVQIIKYEAQFVNQVIFNRKHKQKICQIIYILKFQFLEYKQESFNQMATKQTMIKPLNISEETKQNPQKLHNLEISLSDLTKEFVNKDIDTIESETNKITKFAQGINSIVEKILSYKQSCSKTITDLQKQVSDLTGNIKTYEKDFKNNNKQNEYKKQIENNQKTYLAEWQKRIQIATKINVEALSKLNIDDRKSKAHEVFKWIIVSIYGQPQAKYYWPNFKEQIFERDEGQDFKQRLGKINPSNAKQQQRVKTVDFLKAFSQIVNCKQFKKVGMQIQNIRKVAEIYLNCFEISKKIRDLQTAIEKSRQECRQKDEEAMRWKARSEALQDRIRSNKDYLSILKNIESKLSGKTSIYTQKQNTAKQIVDKLKTNEPIQILPVSDTLQSDKRDQCECEIF